MRTMVALALALVLTGCSTVDPLWIAIDHGNYAELERITRENPETVNQLDPFGSGTPLSSVISSGRSVLHPEFPTNFKGKAINLLLERGASTENVSKSAGVWRSVMEVAAGRSDVEVVQLLLDYGIRFENDQSLHISLETLYSGFLWKDRLSVAQQRHYEQFLRTMTLLLDYGWPIEQRRAPSNLAYETNNYTPLMVAAYADRGPLVELLLARGADISATAGGWTPVALSAAYNPSIDTLNLLIVHQPDSIEARFFEEGETLLHVAARINENRNVREVIQILLSQGADPNALTLRNGYSPLAAAAMSANTEAALALIAGGADLNRGDRKGRTPLDILVANAGEWSSEQAAFQQLLTTAGGTFFTEAPRRSSRPQMAQTNEDNFGAALVGGLAAAAIAFDNGVSESAAVDFGTSMAQDINQGTLSAESFDARRFEAAHQSRQTGALSSASGSRENNPRQLSATGTPENQNNLARTKSKVYEPAPISATKQNTVWHGTREYARDYARLAAAHDVVRQCRANGARADTPTYQMIQQEVAPPRWNYVLPDCKQGGWEGKEWVCQATVSGTCYRIQ